MTDMYIHRVPTFSGTNDLVVNPFSIPSPYGEPKIHPAELWNEGSELLSVCSQMFNDFETKPSINNKASRWVRWYRYKHNNF